MIKATLSLLCNLIKRLTRDPLLVLHASQMGFSQTSSKVNEVCAGSNYYSAEAMKLCPCGGFRSRALSLPGLTGHLRKAWRRVLMLDACVHDSWHCQHRSRHRS